MDDNVVQRVFQEGGRDFYQQPSSSLSSSSSSIIHSLPLHVTRNATGLVAPAIAAGLGALTYTLGTLVPVIGASGFAIAAAAIAIGTVVSSCR